MTEDCVAIICSLIAPIAVLICGILLYKSPPKPNFLYGYRTRTSSKNEHTWKYCNELCGKVYIVLGAISIPAVILSGVIKNGAVKSGAPALINLILCAFLLLSIPFVERKCKKRFPEYFTNEIH